MRRLPFLSNADRRALLVLEWVLMLAVLGCFVYTWIDSDGDATADGKRRPAHENPVATKRTGSAGTYTYATRETPVETFPFDPNTADSTQLLRLGLAPWQVRAVYRYRAKHGRYHTPEDFARLPGMTNEMWQRLAPQIRIAERFRYVDAEAIAVSAHDARRSPASTQRPGHEGDTALPRTAHVSVAVPVPAVPRDTIHFPEKYRSLVLVDLNAADTTQLKKIPGIASYRARQIVRYRESLGGFVSVEQVMESCPLPDDVLDWFVLSQPRPRKINLNKASVQAMRKHPYISFYQARAIYEHRQAHVTLHSLADLLQLKEFTQRDLDRLQPYVEF